MVLAGPGLCDAGWVFEGPEGADVRELVEDPTAVGRWYALSNDNGVFASSDDGLTWRAANSGLPYRVQHLEVAPAGTLFASAVRQESIFVSYDRGASWTARPVPNPSGIPWVYWVSVAGDSILAVAGTSIMQSFDDGRSWELWGPLPYHWLSWRLYPSSDANAMLAFASKSLGGSLARTTDRGATWTPLFGHVVLLVPGRSPDENYGVLNDGTTYRTRNAGETWDYLGGPHVQAVAATAGYRDFEIVIATTTGLHGRRESGAWTKLPGWDGWRWVRSLGAASGGRDRLLIGDSEGVMSRSSGDGWQSRRAGLRGLVATALAWDPETRTLAAGGRYHGPWFRSALAGSWRRPRFYFPGVNSRTLAVVHDKADPTATRLFLARRLQLLASQDGGRSFKEVEWEPQLGFQYEITAIETQPERPGWMSLGTITAFPAISLFDRSEDGGRTWEVLETGGETYGIGWSLVMDPNDPLHLVAATAAPDAAEWCFVRASQDGGATWDELLVKPGCSVARLALDPLAPGTMYLGGFLTGKPLEAESASYPFFVRSLDGGQTWQPPPGAPGCFRDLRVDPDGGLLFVACDTIYWSDDRGETWQIANLDGLPPDLLQVRFLEIADGRLYAGTNAGLYSIELSQAAAKIR
ncbi:MAG: glycoside hydrolase [Acidobacteriota bacterium]|nr:glycoside hydrolase [Acidobacteriota bacterium]